MKKIFKFLGALLLGISTVTSCSPDEFDTAKAGGEPQIENIEAKADVDQTTNIVTFSLPEGLKNVYPIWIFDGKTYSTVNGLTKLFVAAGDYTVEYKIANKYGVSSSSKTLTFHVNNTMFDFGKYYTMLCGDKQGVEGKSKEWRIDNSVVNHMACGDTGTDGTGWWHADPDGKAGMGVYENRVVFATDGKYTFNPGESGTMYVNTGIKGVWPDCEKDEDYQVPATEQTVDFKFEVEGTDLFLVLPAKTQFPYIPFIENWDKDARYKVVDITPKKLTLLVDNGAISWNFILTSGEAVKAFSGFKYDSEFNLWKAIDDAKDYDTHYYYAPGWNQIADPEYKQNGSSYSVSLPEATSDQWQAQCAIKPNALALSADKKYDFSCVISSTTDIKGVTVKLTSVESDKNFVFAERVDLNAYEDKVFYLSEVNNLTENANCELFFDFGGNPENTEVTIKDIVVKDHANDDGTVLPSEEETPQVSWDGVNLLANMPIEITQWYAPGWNQIADAEYTAKDGVYTIKYPEATTDQWQAQFTFNNTGIALDPTKSYDFRMKIVSSTDHPGVTVKITQQDDDNTFITEGRHPIKAYEETWIELIDLKFVVKGEGKGVIDNLKIPFDFGGVLAGTEIIISDMHLQEHQGPKTIAWDLTGEKNLWLKGAHETISFHYAPGWNKIADPETKIAGNSYTITLPTATTDQWQAQWHISTELGKADISADKKYNVRFTIVSDQDQPGITFKFTENGNDDNFLTADRHAGVAYEETVIELTDLSLSKGDITNESFKLALDFAGNPENSEITIKDIIIQEAE